MRVKTNTCGREGQTTNQSSMNAEREMKHNASTMRESRQG